MDKVCGMTALGLSAALRRRELSAREAALACLARMEEREPQLHAYLTVSRDEALAEADAADRRLAAGEPLSPLDGVPMAVKDNLCTKGVRTTCASRMLEGFVPPYDAEAVSRLGRAGAVLLGKTNLDEFAMGSDTGTSAFGPTANPIDPSRVPGGSSGGSAAAVAAGEALFALGAPARRPVRRRRPAPDVRAHLAVRPRRLRAVARSGRPCDEGRARLRRRPRGDGRV